MRSMVETTFPAIIEGLKHVASVVGQIVVEEYKKRPGERTIQQFHRNVLGYYKAVLEVKKGKGDAIKIAKHMENDYVFSFYVRHENVEQIVRALKLVSILDKQERHTIIHWILRTLEATKNIAIL